MSDRSGARAFPFFEVLAVFLVLASLAFFFAAVGFLARHDYVGGGLLTGIGLAVILVGAEMARLALADRS